MSGTSARAVAGDDGGGAVRLDLLAVLRRAASEDDRISLAEMPDVPVDLLALLSDDVDSVRIRVAAHPATPADVLVRLAGDPRPTVCAEVASNPSAPDEAFRLLITHTYAGQFALANEHCPSDLLLGIADSTSEQLRYGATWNPVCPPDLRERLLLALGTGSNPHWRAVVAADGRTPKPLRERLLHDSNAQVRSAAKSSASRRVTTPPWPGGSASYWYSLQRDELARTWAARWDPAPPAHGWPTLLAESASAGWIGVLALPQFTRFVDVPDSWITGTEEQRFAIATGTSDPGVLAVLAKGQPLAIRMSVIRNANVPDHVLDVLARDRSKKVRAEAQHSQWLRGTGVSWPGQSVRRATRPLPGPSAPPPELTPTTDAKERERIARTSALDSSPEVLATLSKDRSKWVRVAVATNPTTPIDVVVSMHRDPAWEVRSAVASHVMCPVAVLSELSLDRSVAVRRVVIQHPEVTEEIRAQAVLMGV